MDAAAWLGMHEMQVLDAEGAHTLLGDGDDGGGGGSSSGGSQCAQRRRRRLLDVGSGMGGATLPLAPLFDDVICTEVSRPAARVLRKRGLAVIEAPTLEHPLVLQAAADHVDGFDVVSMFNLLDRVHEPGAVLQQAAALTAARRGRVLVALALPYTPFVVQPHSGCASAQRAPLIHVAGAGHAADGYTSWEGAAGAMALALEAATGKHRLRVEKMARVPYLCQGDAETAPFYVLDNVVFVLAPPSGRGEYD